METIRCFFFFAFLVLFLQGHVSVHAFTGTYGVNYGRVADNLPAPESVVTLLKAAKIKNIRIYDADHSVLNAFKGSGLELVVMIPNELLTDMSVNEDSAMNWVKQNVQPFLPGTDIRGIAVGNEILGQGNQELAEVLLGAVTNVYSALDRLQLSDRIQVSTPHSEGVFQNSFPPSSCTFKDDVMQYMKPLLQLFSEKGSPFFLNAYPFLAYKSDSKNINLNYALFLKNPGIYDSKTNLHYDNMFDAQVDAGYAALEAAGFGKMELLKKKGTPRRPKIAVKAYVFALFNEDLKPGPTSERNFGLFKADGSIAYNMGFTGLRPSSASRMDIRAPYSMVLAACAAILLLL
ncbi:Glucan endo-1,3-beta-glucosidase 11 [Acorus calamus]|uniref:Glucan endo-1,3-beta-glucosidase 11 n=1 Tax=Acorus calamus TaxID=4465 RepID=A0AAV9BZX5_ACOCL|nr:Glucan endo-1,3-beta-glucosidase 11 [Acorus calamus]